jgi:ribonuclease P protein component
MLPKKNRLTQKEFEEVFKKGKIKESEFFLFKALPSPSASGKFAVAVPKKQAKNNAEKNSLKRKIFNALYLTPIVTQPIFLIVITKPTAHTLSFEEIAKTLQELAQ